MIEQVKVAYRYLFVIGAGALLLALSLAVPIISTNEDFSIYNTGWNGCSGLGREAYGTGKLLPTIDVTGSSKDRILHRSFADLEGEVKPPASVLVIIGPETTFSSDEGDFVHRFLLRGGTVLLADDFGSANSLLSQLNTSSRFSRERMLDLSFMRTGDFAVAVDTSPHPFTEGVLMLLLNHPSTIAPAPYARSLVNSTGASWLDIDEDGSRDLEEPEGPFPLLSIEAYGKGELVLLSDPSVLINQMQGKMNDSDLARNLLTGISRNRDVLLIDESHRDASDPLRAAGVYVKDVPISSKLLVLVPLTLMFLFASSPLPREVYRRAESLFSNLLRRRKAAGMSEEELLGKVLKRHPDWDKGALLRIMSSMEGGS